MASSLVLYDDSVSQSCCDASNQKTQSAQTAFTSRSCRIPYHWQLVQDTRLSAMGSVRQHAQGTWSVHSEDSHLIAYLTYHIAGGDLLYFQGLGHGLLILGTRATASELLDKRAAIYSSRPAVALIELYVSSSQKFSRLLPLTSCSSLCSVSDSAPGSSVRCRTSQSGANTVARSTNTSTVDLPTHSTQSSTRNETPSSHGSVKTPKIGQNLLPGTQPKFPSHPSQKHHI